MWVLFHDYTNTFQNKKCYQCKIIRNVPNAKSIRLITPTRPKNAQ